MMQPKIEFTPEALRAAFIEKHARPEDAAILRKFFDTLEIDVSEVRDLEYRGVSNFVGDFMAAGAIAFSDNHFAALLLVSGVVREGSLGYFQALCDMIDAAIFCGHRTDAEMAAQITEEVAVCEHEAQKWWIIINRSQHSQLWVRDNLTDEATLERLAATGESAETQQKYIATMVNPVHMPWTKDHPFGLKSLADVVNKFQFRPNCACKIANYLNTPFSKKLGNFSLDDLEAARIAQLAEYKYDDSMDLALNQALAAKSISG